MIGQNAARIAFRARAKTVTVATTGSTSLSATSTGYARAAGSFITDGFRAGMEITSVTGFSTSANNQATSAQGRVITSVSALALTCSGTSTESAVTATITVGLPYQLARENVQFEPAPDFPYVEESFVPATSTMLTVPYSGGAMVETGLYLLKVYGLSDYGPDAIGAYTDALKALFSPGTLIASTSDSIYCNGNPGPWVGQLIPIEGGWTVAVLTIPWKAYTNNAVAA